MAVFFPELTASKEQTAVTSIEVLREHVEGLDYRNCKTLGGLLHAMERRRNKAENKFAVPKKLVKSLNE
jgi:hypothetical protein